MSHARARTTLPVLLARIWTGGAAILAVACTPGLLGGCSSLRDAARTYAEPQEPSSTVRGQDLAQPRTPQDALVTIARLEDARSDGGGLLQVLLTWDDDDVRTRAARALGRLSREAFGRAVTEPLANALGDRSARVRAEAAFALGMRGDPGAAAALARNWSDADDTVRARIVEAASKLEGVELHERVLASAGDDAEVVRIEVAVAPHRWPADGPAARRADEALLRICARPDESAEVVWRALFSLSRRRAAAGLDAFTAHAGDADARARIFAVRGLARLVPTAPPDAREKLLVALTGALQDADARVATEAAIGLGALSDARAAGALTGGDETTGELQHRSFHVRAAAYAALAGIDLEPARLAMLFEAGRDDPSPTVRAAALVAEARARGGLALPHVLDVLERGDPADRAAAARAAAELPADQAQPLLGRLAQDERARVAAIAIEGLARIAEPEARALITNFLESPDEGLRLAAVIAMRVRPDARDFPMLRAAYRSATGELGPELRFNVLRNMGTIETAEARSFLRAARADEHPWVRHVAREVLGETGDAVPAPKPKPAELPPRPAREGRRNPTVEIRTSKGTLVFELFPREAPVHVHSFLELARRGHYDGLDFHRIVSDFVIQGGCHRGDGNGAGTWRGPDDSLRAEIGARKYVRGSLGMPRNEDPESGGSQFFVTHRPTPHLDGGYTIFGELREGFDVLDTIEVGDGILAVVAR